MSNAAGIGLVIFLKDEVYDIAGWLAWHVALGFDTIFVIDDGSTDGTDEIVKSAGLSYDIRYEKAVQDVDDYYQRQQNEYRRILEHCKHFAWLCFLDADEYLLLRDDDTVTEFMSRYQDAQGVAVNWRLYGSGWQVLRPLVPAPSAYMRHSSLQEPINRHVKSFVRPDQQEGLYNVHAFRVEAARYLDTDGQPVRWSATPGIIHGQALWSTALIMHFQTRSMEHFTERAERRRDQSIDARAWINEDWNKEEDHSPSRFFGRMFNILARIELETSSSLCRLIEALRPDSETGLGHDQQAAAMKAAREPGNALQVEETGLFRFFARRRPPVKKPFHAAQPHYENRPVLKVSRLCSHFNTTIGIDAATNLLAHGAMEDTGREDLQPVFLIRSDDGDSAALLVRSIATRMPLRLDGNRQAAAVVAVELDELSNGLATLRTPITRLFLTAEPAASGGVGRIRVNRRLARDWEMFKLNKADISELDPATRTMSEAYFALSTLDLTADNLIRWLSTHETSVTSPLLQIILRRLPKPERIRLSSRLAASVASELLAGSQYS